MGSRENGPKGERIGILQLELASQAERQWESLFSLVYVKNRIAGRSATSLEGSFRFNEDGPIDYIAQVMPLGTVSLKPHFLTIVVLRNDDIVMAGMASANWEGSSPKVADIRLFGQRTKEMELDPLVIAALGQLSVSPVSENLQHASANVDFPMRPQSRVH